MISLPSKVKHFNGAERCYHTAMTSQTGFSSSMLFQSINDDLNASLATADELSKEFSSLLNQTSSSDYNTKSQTSSTIPRVNPVSPGPSSTSITINDSSVSTLPSSPVFTTSPLSSPKIRREVSSPQAGSESYLYRKQSPRQSPHMPRRNSPSRYNRSPQGSISSPISTPISFDQSGRSTMPHPSSSLLNPYDNSQMGRRSPRPDRSTSPLAFNHPMSNTLPRNFGGFKQQAPANESLQRQRSPAKWNETDLDVSYERKPHHTYDKTEWLRPSVPNSNWRESNLDGPPLPPNPKKDPRSPSLQLSHGSLPRNACIAASPDGTTLYQPILSRISIPPMSGRSRQNKPIPLSVIMRLQNPHWGAMSTNYPGVQRAEGDMAPFQPAMPIPREFFHQPVLPPQQCPPELRQPAVYSDALNPGDVDAELERLDFVHRMPVISETPSIPVRGRKAERDVPKAPRPLSPTRLQPVVAPEAQNQEIPNLEELLRIRAEIPRALKRRGSVDHSLPMKKDSQYHSAHYKHLINKLFHRKSHSHKGEQGSETSSSSEGEDSAAPPPVPAPQTSTTVPHDYKSYHSILRQPHRESKGSGRRARLSPLVLLLDGALVGELETVQRAVQEMSDPSQPNDEGITALHNAICGGHYNVVDFLVRIGANVSAPDSHGWTPLHCAASCNDRPLCEFLVRNGAAVMAITESDSSTASQKCDPYAVGFDECESFLRGVEEAIGLENNGVVYALWSYPAQAPDELSFKEGDMVTILQKPEGLDWWWASLCGKEGLVPSNYFGIFPKVRPKSLC
ncbi:hypothetical protein PAMP_018251 [Pampus punctatissimus]